ncbi:MAG: peptidylprolyl isomerase [Alphaproteobacteria bacterium]
MASMSHIVRGGILGLASAVWLALPVPQAHAQTVAIVNGTELTQEDVVRLFQGLRPEVQANGMEALYPFLLEELIAREVLVSQARAEGFDQTPEMAAQLEAFQQEMIYNAYVVDQAEGQVSDSDVQAAYDELVGQMPEEEEINVSHILVESREEAESVIQRVTAGEVFADLARELSIDTGSGANGGALGWSRRGMFVPEFEEAAFALSANTFTSVPVQSDFGWHVILVSERRQIEPPPLEEVADPIRQRLAEQEARGVVEAAVAGASVERFDLNGNPLPAQ